MFGRVAAKAMNIASRSQRTVVPRRAMGGGHGPKKSATPYDAPAAEGYEKTPYFLGMGPSWKPEGHEAITLVTFAVCFGVLAFGGEEESDSFRRWCRREALAREEHVANGGEIEFGKYYQNLLFESSEAGDTMPTVIPRE